MMMKSERILRTIVVDDHCFIIFFLIRNTRLRFKIHSIQKWNQTIVDSAQNCLAVTRSDIPLQFPQFYRSPLLLYKQMIDDSCMLLGVQFLGSRFAVLVLAISELRFTSQFYVRQIVCSKSFASFQLTNSIFLASNVQVIGYTAFRSASSILCIFSRYRPYF